jgi:hypothetical protein
MIFPLLIAICSSAFGFVPNQVEPVRLDRFDSGEILGMEFGLKEPLFTETQIELEAQEELESLELNSLRSESSEFYLEAASPLPLATLKNAASLIMSGVSVWSLISGNKPSASFSQASVDVLPQGVHSWTQMQGWSKPRSYRVTRVYRSLLGFEVVRFVYRIVYTYGGNLGSRGHYLTKLHAIPVDLQVSSGYEFSATAGVENITNAGTTEDPIAAVEFYVKWSIKTLLKESTREDRFYIRGEGSFLELK